MADKLADCIKMLGYLDKDSIKFLYNAGKQGALPFTVEEERIYMNFILYKNGIVDYSGTDGKNNGNFVSYYQRPDIKICGLIPTEALINFAYSKLKNICFETAANHVMQRLIEHELKYNALEFLLNDDKAVH